MLQTCIQGKCVSDVPCVGDVKLDHIRFKILPEVLTIDDVGGYRALTNIQIWKPFTAKVAIQLFVP